MPIGQSMRKRLPPGPRWARALAFALIVSTAIPAAAGPRSPTEILFIAVAKGDTALVRRSLAAGADPQARTPAGNTPRTLALSLGHTEIARILAAAEGQTGPQKAGASPWAADLAAMPTSNPFDPRAALPTAPPIVGEIRDRIPAAPTPSDAPPDKAPLGAVVETPISTDEKDPVVSPPTPAEAMPRPPSSSTDAADESDRANAPALDPLSSFFRAMAGALAPTSPPETAPTEPAPAEGPPTAGPVPPLPKSTPSPPTLAEAAPPSAATPVDEPAISTPAENAVSPAPGADPVTRLFSSIAAALQPTPTPMPAAVTTVDTPNPIPVDVATKETPISDETGRDPKTESPTATAPSTTQISPTAQEIMSPLRATRPPTATATPAPQETASEPTPAPAPTPTQAAVAIPELESPPARDPVQRLIASLANVLSPTPAPAWQKSDPPPSASAVPEHGAPSAPPTEIAMSVAPPLPGPGPEPKYEIGPVSVTLGFDTAAREGASPPPANARFATELPPRDTSSPAIEADVVPKTVEPPPSTDRPLAPTVVAALAAQNPEPAPSPFNVPVIETERRPALQKVELALGQSATVGRPLAAFAPEPGDCIAKPAWTAAFCVISIDWTAAIGETFDVRAAEYHGTQAVVRVEGDSVVHYHALFPAESFVHVREHFIARFGLPTESENTPMPTIGHPKQRNAVSRWKSQQEGNRSVVLEVRAYDDVRGYLPDAAHGAVRLYAEGARPVFGQLNTSDLMVRRMRGSRVDVGSVR